MEVSLTVEEAACWVREVIWRLRMVDLDDWIGVEVERPARRGVRDGLAREASAGTLRAMERRIVNYQDR